MDLSISNARFGGRVAALLAFLIAVLPSLALADLNEEQKLAPTANAGAGAGNSSAIFGDTSVVGAPGDSGSGCAAGAGAAYVFTRSGTIWTNVATLCASNGASGDQFGASVSINAGNIAVGAPGASAGAGAVYVYSGSGATWTENATILNAGATAGGHLGAAVSIQGFTVAAGAPNTTVGSRTDVGLTFVYTSNNAGDTWTHTTFRPNGGQARNGSLFGSAVSLSGSTILVGAPGYTTGQQHSGSIFIFVNSGSIWTQQAKIRPANIANALTGTGVSLFQDSAAFGAIGTNKVYVYTRTGTTWTNTATVSGPGGSNFGANVSLQGGPAFSFLSVGAPNANSAAGSAYEYGSNGAAYSLLNQLIASNNDTVAGDAFGASTGLDSGRIIVGAPDNGGTGAAYVFKFQDPSVTTITGFITDGDFSTKSLTGVPYSVFVTVADNSGGTGTPLGLVHLNDSNGGSCDAALVPSLDPDGHSTGSCMLTSNFFGSLTMTALYDGDANFSASSDSHQHDVTGDHFVFNPATPDNVLQGTKATNAVVELHNGADALIDDSATAVTVTILDTCGDTDTIGTLTLSHGVADFSGIGPNFYTLTSGGALNYSAAQEPFVLATSPSSANSGSFDVVANSDMIFPDGFEDCRL